MKPNKEKLKQSVVLMAILITGAVVLLSLHQFITSFLGALIFFVLFRSSMKRLVENRGWKKPLAAWIILLLSFLIFLVPLVTLGYMLYHEILSFVNAPAVFEEYIKKWDASSQDLLGFRLMSDDTLASVQKEVLNFVSNALNSTLSLVAGVSVMYFLLYYLLVNSDELSSDLKKYSPFNKRENTILFIEELKSQTYSNSLAVPILAIIQGACASLGYWIFGLDNPVFWGIITGFFSIIPVVGTAIIWFPAAIILMATSDQLWHGLGLWAYGALIIANIDNVMRFVLQKKFADVHPIITVFGVIVGLKLFGLPGLIFGPLLISYFLILIKVYRNEYWEEPTIEK